MKLYVWRVYARDYSSGLAVALANDSEEARALIEQAAEGYRAEELKESPEIYDLDTPIAFQVTGGS